MMVGFNFEFNVRNNPQSLNAAERRLLITTTNDKGQFSSRRRQGLKEWPKSIVDKRGPRGMTASEFAYLFPDIPID